MASVPALGGFGFVGVTSRLEYSSWMANRSIQFADMLAGMVQGHYEDGDSRPWNRIRSNISYKTLYF